MRERLVVLVSARRGGGDRPAERALRELEHRGVEVRRFDAAGDVDLARSEAAARALDDGFDELMWIDDDLVFEADDVFRLRRIEEPVVCGVYPRTGQSSVSVHIVRGGPLLTFAAHGALVEVRRAVTGFMYTQRRMYESIPRGSCFLPFEGLRGDDAFCERIRRAGFRILVDTGLRIRPATPPFVIYEFFLDEPPPHGV